VQTRVSSKGQVEISGTHAGHALIRFLCDLRLADPKAFTQGDRMSRLFVAVAF
jgi:hypothetical protein